jgi:hypothetical protein
MEAGSLQADDVTLHVTGPQAVCITVVKCAYARLLSALQAVPSQVTGVARDSMESATYAMSVHLPAPVQCSQFDLDKGSVSMRSSALHFTWSLTKRVSVSHDCVDSCRTCLDRADSQCEA